MQTSQYEIACKISKYCLRDCIKFEFGLIVDWTFLWRAITIGNLDPYLGNNAVVSSLKFQENQINMCQSLRKFFSAEEALGKKLVGARSKLVLVEVLLCTDVVTVNFVL